MTFDIQYLFTITHFFLKDIYMWMNEQLLTYFVIINIDIIEQIDN